MYMSQDWLMRQIQIMVDAVSRIVFQKGSLEYDLKEEAGQVLPQTDLFRRELTDLLAQRRLCDAEDLLFARLEPGNHAHLAAALEFYQALNQLTDEELGDGDFSRSEINDGLSDILRQFGLFLPGF